MRNLKKFLALVLALMMVVSVMVTVNAASYGDDADIDYKEAVEVMSAIKVLQGDGTNFYPDKTLTRREAAEIIAKMLVGPETAKLLPPADSFSDVKATDWGSGSINYCSVANIVAGDGAGHFYPDLEVNGYQFGKMLLAALGEDGTDYTGTGWELKVLTKMREMKLDEGLVTPANLTREKAAELAMNALNYGSKVTTTATKYIVLAAGGTNVPTNVGEAYDSYTAARDATKKATPAATLGTDYTISAITVTETVTEDSLADTVFGVTKTDTTGTADSMGRPSTIYSNDGWADDLVFADEPDGVVVIKKSTDTALSAAKSVSKKVTAVGTTYVNGASGTLQVGDVAEVYIDSTGTGATVCATRYNVIGKLSDNVATKTQDGTLYVRLPGISALTNWTAAAKVNGYEGLAKNDVIYGYADKDGVYTLAKAGSFTGKLSSVSGTTFTIGGADYTKNDNYPASLSNDPLTGSYNFDDEYTFYTDDNGFLVYAVPAAKAQSSEYVILQEIAFVNNGGLNASKYAEARLVHMDGTTEIVRIASVKTTAGKAYTVGGTDALNDSTSNGINDTVNNLVNTTAFTYTVTDGAYALTEATVTTLSGATANQPVTIKRNAVVITSGQNGGTTTPVDNSTVFIVGKKTSSGFGNTFDVYTGRANVPDITVNTTTETAKQTVVVIKGTDGVADYVYVPAWTDNTSTVSGEGILLLSATPKSTVTVKGATYGVFPVIVNGDHYDEVKIKQTASSVYGGQTLAKGTVYAPSYSDDVITVLSTPTVAASNTSASTNFGFTVASGTLIFGDTPATYSVADSAAVFFLQKDGGKIVGATKGTGAELTSDKNDYIYVVLGTGTENRTVKYAVVDENDDADAGLILEDLKGGSDGSTAITGAPENGTKLGQTTTINCASSDTSIKLKLKPTGVGVTLRMNSSGRYEAYTAKNEITLTGTQGSTTTLKVEVKTVDGGTTEYTINFVLAAAAGAAG